MFMFHLTFVINCIIYLHKDKFGCMWKIFFKYIKWLKTNPYSFKFIKTTNIKGLLLQFKCSYPLSTAIQIIRYFSVNDIRISKNNYHK